MTTMPRTLARIAVALVLACSVARAQTPAEMDAAKKEYDAGQVAYNLGNYDEALKRYTRAYELSKLPALLFNLAQAHRKLYEGSGPLDNLRRARELYRSYLRNVPISNERPVAEQLLKEVEAEYEKQLHAQKDKLLVEAKGQKALDLAEDFLGQGDSDAARAALERFQKTPGNARPEVARGYRSKARVAAAASDPIGAEQAFAAALELDPSTSPPPDSEPSAQAAWKRAEERMAGKPPLKLQHVPPTRLKIGAVPKLRIEVVSDTNDLVRGLELHYRAGQSAWAVTPIKAGDVTFPATFNAGLAPGTRIEYWVGAVGEEAAQLDALGSLALPFVLHVDEKPAKPIYKRWQFWVGLGAGVAVAAGAAAAIGVTQAPPERVGIPVVNTVQGALTGR